MSTHKDFLAPRLTGKRFDDHSIPLELLEDLSVMEQLIVEMAKVVYLEKNPTRQRVPRGFEENVSLKLCAVDEGSAILKIALIYALGGSTSGQQTLDLFPDPNYAYFEEARDRVYNGIAAANNGENITNYIPEPLLGYFNRIGKRLKEDEAINFNPGSSKNLNLDRNTRKKLVLASSSIKQVTAETYIFAQIPEVDKNKQTFTLLIEGTQRISSVLPDPHYETIMKAFNDFEKNCKVVVKGIGRFNQNDKLESFEAIEQISILDPLDVMYRLDELAKLEDGWLDSSGVAPRRDDLMWFYQMFESNFDKNLPLPAIFPTPEGGIQTEWNIGGSEISLTINLDSKVGDYHSYNFLSKEEASLELKLDEPASWALLNDSLSHLISA